MHKAAKQILVCALGLILFCILGRLTVFRSYTAYIPLSSFHSGAPSEEPAFRLEAAAPEIARPEAESWREDYVSVRIHPGQPGTADLELFDQNGDPVGFFMLKVDRFGTVYDPQTSGFTGDTGVLIAVTLFWFLVSAIMLWHYRQARGPAYYAYSTIYFAGFSLFSLASGLLMLFVTISHISDPFYYPMVTAYSTINGASRQYMVLTLPLLVAFAVAMAISNIALLRHERTRLQNVLGLIISLLLLAGEAVGFLLFYRDFMGSEWEARVQSTLENVYATVFVYFECMLTGSVICGIHAARHQPAPDQDVIVILGCWFRKDGTLPPLLRGRVDRALDFWKAQKASTGKEALFIPSGGQGADEPMPEAEAMRLYLEAQGVPPELIVPETRSLNTYQNMAFSREIADGRQVRGKAVFATTNYHVFRSGVWANQAGFPAEGIGARTRWWYWPNAFMRECVGLLQKRWKQEILLLVLLVAFFGLLSLVLW